MYKKQYALTYNSSSLTKAHNTPLTFTSQPNQKYKTQRFKCQKQVDQNTVVSMQTDSIDKKSFVSFQELNLNNNKWIIFDTFTPEESNRQKCQKSNKKFQNTYSNKEFSRLGSNLLKRVDKENNKNQTQFNEQTKSSFQNKELNQLLTKSRTNITKIKAKTILQQIKFTSSILKDETNKRNEVFRRVEQVKTARTQSNTANLSKNLLLTKVKTITQSKNAGEQLAISLTTKKETTKCLQSIKNEKPSANSPQVQLSANQPDRKDQKSQLEVSMNKTSYLVLAQYYDKVYLLEPNLMQRPYTDNPYESFDLWQHSYNSPQLTQSQAQHKVENIPEKDTKLQKDNITHIKKRSFTTKETENMMTSIVSNPLQQLTSAPFTSSLSNLLQKDPSPSIQITTKKYPELSMQEFFLPQQNIHFINIEPSGQTSLLPRQLSPPIYIKNKVIYTKIYCYHNQELVNWLNLLLKVQPELIFQIFLPFQDNQYSCNLYEKGKPRVVNVGGQLPFSANLFPLYGTIQQYIWFCVLLKALAKLNNSYKAINNLNFRYLCKTIINKDFIPYQLDSSDKEAIRQLRKLIGQAKKGSLFVVAAKQNIFYKVSSLSYNKSLSQKQQDRQKIIISESLGNTIRDQGQNYRTLDEFLNKKKKELTQKRIIKNTRIHLTGVGSNIKLTINQLRTDYQLYHPQSIQQTAQ